MTDDKMDARLRAAGERWRSANTAVAEVPDATAEIEIRTVPRVRHRWVTAASAAVVAAAVVVGAVLVSRTNDGPNATSTEAANGLTGTNWVLTGTPGSTLRIATDGTLIGNDGCNSLSGSAKINGPKLTLVLATTEMYCPGVSTGKTALILSGTVTWSVSGGRLTITKSGVGSLTYRAQTTDRSHTDPSHLVKISWRLDATQTTSGSGADGAVSNTSAISRSLVVFDGNGGFTVAHRCYTDRGSADLSNGSARLAGVTLKSAIPCASNAESKAGQDENDLVDSVLTGRVGWSITGDQLTISKDGTALTFTKS